MSAPRFRVLVTYRTTRVTGQHKPTQHSPAWITGQVRQQVYSAENLRAAMLILAREQSRRDAIRVELTVSIEAWERPRD